MPMMTRPKRFCAPARNGAAQANASNSARARTNPPNDGRGPGAAALSAGVAAGVAVAVGLVAAGLPAVGLAAVVWPAVASTFSSRSAWMIGGM
jgi:hypothetical protein